jgi:hypothetical protein
MLLGKREVGEPQRDVVARAERTLEIMHRWGYAPTLDLLASSLLGGSVTREELAVALSRSNPVRVEDGFAYLTAHGHLVGKSKKRVESHRVLNGEGQRIAAEFTRELVRLCPLVECVALTGSLASGGYRTGDDIDFDLFVRSGAKYTSYLISNLIGLRYAWRYRDRAPEEILRTPVLPKVTCINVVWPHDETVPFARRDEGLAFELARCVPMHGSVRFRQMLEDNPWIRAYFPQLYDRAWPEEESPEPNPLGRFLASVAKRPRLMRALEALSFGAFWILYRFVQGTRRKDPAARARMEFLRRVKYPYEVFEKTSESTR